MPSITVCQAGWMRTGHGAAPVWTENWKRAREGVKEAASARSVRRREDSMMDARKWGRGQQGIV